MNALSEWRQEYAALADFIKANPEIVIKRNEVSIPVGLREDFYRRFDAVRRAVVECFYGALPAEIGLLSNHYMRIEKEIIAALRLEGILMPLDLSSFLHNPKEGLIRALYNRMFDTLQEKITVDEFESLAESDLQAAAADLFRLGYEYWADMTFLKLLEPDEAFQVDLDEDYKPILTQIRDISFGRQAHHPTMCIPEFVIHSRKVNRYVAVKAALAREIETFVVPFKPPVRPKKKTGDTSFTLDSRVMLVSFLPSKEQIPIYADIYECTLTSPDWMIEYINGNELNDPAALELVRRHLQDMNPKLGTCLVVVNPGRDPMAEDLLDNIRAVAAGFDESTLKSVVDALAQNA